MERLKFRVSYSFWIFTVVAIVLKQGYFAAMYSIAMVLHEVSHYVVAKKLFYRCNEIRLSVFGAVLYGDFQDVAGSDRIKIALAGPFCNLVLALACLALWWIKPESYYFTETFFTSNVGMACVNLLPCYPLDGGRVLTGVLEKKYPKSALRCTKICAYILSVALFLVFMLSLFTGDNLFALGLFAIGLLSGAFTKSGGECYIKTTFAQNKRKFLKKGMEKKTLVFDWNCHLSDVVKRMQGNYLYCLEVVDGDMQVQKKYDIAQLEKLVLEIPLNTLLKNLPT